MFNFAYYFFNKLNLNFFSRTISINSIQIQTQSKILKITFD